MANYIKTNILFEAYVCIDVEYSKDEDSSELKATIDNYIHSRSAHFLYSDVTTEIRFKEGSLKAYATVRGTLKQAVDDTHDDFVTAINHLFWFAKRLSDAAVMEVAYSSGSSLGTIKRTEARLGIIGKTKRTLDDFQSLKIAYDEQSAESLIKRLIKTRNASQRLLAIVEGTEDQTLIANEFTKALSKVPVRLNATALLQTTKETYALERKEFSDMLKKYQ